MLNEKIQQYEDIKRARYIIIALPIFIAAALLYLGVYDDDVILPKNDKITISHLDYYCIVFKDKHFLEGKIGNTCFGHEYKIPKGLTYYGYKGLGFLSPGEYKVPRIDVKGTYYVLGIYKTSFLITVYALFASIYYRVFLMKRR